MCLKKIWQHRCLIQYLVQLDDATLENTNAYRTSFCCAVMISPYIHIFVSLGHPDLLRSTHTLSGLAPARLYCRQCLPRGSRLASVNTCSANGLFSGLSSSRDIPHMSCESPGGVGVGRQRRRSSLLVRSAFSAASTLCKVGKVKIRRI